MTPTERLVVEQARNYVGRALTILHTKDKLATTAEREEAESKALKRLRSAEDYLTTLLKPIEASQEMLDALVTCQRYIGFMAECPNLQGVDWATLNQIACSAITKAKGQKP